MKRSLCPYQVVFIGDKASRKNLHQDVPFVGTKSYKTLLLWIADLDLSIDQIRVLNSCMDDFGLAIGYLQCDRDDNSIKYIALGDRASQRLGTIGIKHFKMDHPSGLNRKLNNKKYVTKMLKQCYEYLRT